jgi:hypothetical protein
MGTAMAHKVIQALFNEGIEDAAGVRQTLRGDFVLFGANRWDPANRWFSMPGLSYLSGASVIASYADRDGVKDTGYGVLLTFSNVYSIGAVRYGKETGAVLWSDLANLLRERYRGRYQRFRIEARISRVGCGEVPHMVMDTVVGCSWKKPLKAHASGTRCGYGHRHRLRIFPMRRRPARSM